MKSILLLIWTLILLSSCALREREFVYPQLVVKDQKWHDSFGGIEIPVSLHYQEQFKVHFKVKCQQKDNLVVLNTAAPLQSNLKFLQAPVLEINGEKYSANETHVATKVFKDYSWHEVHEFDAKQIEYRYSASQCGGLKNASHVRITIQPFEIFLDGKNLAIPMLNTQHALKDAESEDLARTINTTDMYKIDSQFNTTLKKLNVRVVSGTRSTELVIGFTVPKSVSVSYQTIPHIVSKDLKTIIASKTTNNQNPNHQTDHFLHFPMEGITAETENGMTIKLDGIHFNGASLGIPDMTFYITREKHTVPVSM